MAKSEWTRQHIGGYIFSDPDKEWTDHANENQYKNHQVPYAKHGHQLVFETWNTLISTRNRFMYKTVYGRKHNEVECSSFGVKWICKILMTAQKYREKHLWLVFFYTHSFASRPELMDENYRPHCIDPIRKRVVPF